MASKYCGGEEEEWEVVNVRRFHELEQSLPKDPFPMPKIDQPVDATIGIL